MIGSLARKRTNVVALAALLALIAAMFVAYGPAQAAEGDVDSNTAYCHLEDGSTTNYRLANAANDDPVHVEVSGADAEIKCTKADVLKKARVTPNGTSNPGVEFFDPELVVSFAGAAKVPGSVAVKAYVKNGLGGITYSTLAPAAGASVSPATSASLIGTDAAGTSVDTSSTGTSTANGITSLLLVPGASGTYTVQIIVVDNAPTPNYLLGEASVTVGESAPTVDEKVASATLELDYANYGIPTQSISGEVKEDGTEPAAGDIWLKLTVKNSLGKAATDTDLTAIQVVGLNATFDVRPPNDEGTQRNEGGTQIATGDHVAASSTAANIVNTMYIKVESVGDAARKIPVYVQLNASVMSNTVDLTFTGATDDIAISEATKTLPSKSGKLTFSVTGKDKAGNEGTPLAASAVSVRVLDSDGKAVASNPSIAKVQATMAGTTTPDPNKVTLTVTTNTAAADPAAKSGTYTIEATFGSKKQTTTFSIAGPAANIALSADPEMGTMVGELVTLTATVTDEAGVNVPDDTEVMFAATAGGGASVISGATAKTKDGVATASLGVFGQGTTFVFATSGTAQGNLTFTSTAGTPDPEPDAPVVDKVELADVGQLSHGDSVTVTATVTDADGNPMPDGTIVIFSLAGSGTLFSPSTVSTVGGNASAEIVNLTDNIWVRAFSGTTSSVSMEIDVESASEESDRKAKEAEDKRIADAEQAAADSADDAADEAAKAADAADAADDADSPEDAQSAADDAAAAATAAQTAADAAKASADEAGTDDAQDSADAAQGSADDAKASAEDAQTSADEAAQAAKDEEEKQRQEEEQAKQDRQAEIDEVVRKALEDAAAEPTGIDCLSATSGFSAWTCEAGSSASALFTALSERGATAIHLWNGSAWVRYSVVDGAEVPGSTDFTVTENDILFISN